ncbi:MAG: ABC transporter substrate-binding protein [Coprobacillus sp.]
MKKLVKGLLVSALSLTVLVGCGSSSDASKKTLKVYNWGEYVDKSVISNFEKEFNCEVIYENFDSNETMYTKLQGGDHYDVMVPSEYMIERMIKEDLLQKIDWSLMTNKDSIDNLVLNQPFDKENDYWVPYFYGNVGILYDKTKVKENDLNAGWEVLRNPQFKGSVYMYDSERDSFMVALKALGFSMNTTNEDEIKKAYNWLVEQRDLVDPVYGTDDIIDAMRNSEKSMAVMYSGDAAAVMADNENMGFYMPNEGTNVWFDGFVVSKDCKETKLAMEFINYMVSDDNALLNTLEVGYLTSNVNAAKEAKLEDYKDNSAYAIRKEKNDEVFAYQPQEVRTIFSEYFNKVKNH